MHHGRVSVPLLPAGRWRLWLPPDWPFGEPPFATAVGLEWVSRQPGHPCSYGLLGGHLTGTGEAAITAPVAGDPFPGSLAGRAEEVRTGLPDEYRPVVLAATDNRPLVITTAAHGLVGSCALVFHRLTTVLADILEGRIEPTTVAATTAWAAFR